MEMNEQFLSQIRTIIEEVFDEKFKPIRQEIEAIKAEIKEIKKTLASMDKRLKNLEKHHGYENLDGVTLKIIRPEEEEM